MGLLHKENYKYPDNFSLKTDISVERHNSGFLFVTEGLCCAVSPGILKLTEIKRGVVPGQLNTSYKNYGLLVKVSNE